MGVLDSVIREKQYPPRRIMLYGPHGIGKTSWAAAWPDVLLLPTEDGAAHVECAKLPVLKKYEYVMEALTEISSPNTEHEFGAIAIDSSDWLERLIWDWICRTKGVECLADIPYGRGYSQAAVILRDVLKMLDACRARGMHVILTAHSEIVKLNLPTGESFDKFAPKLHKEASTLLQEWCDEVLFAHYQIRTKTKEEAFGREREVPIGEGERIVYTEERPTFYAKNRLGLPPAVEFDPAAIIKAASGESK